jgi:hypothetical protein
MYQYVQLKLAYLQYGMHHVAYSTQVWLSPLQGFQGLPRAVTQWTCSRKVEWMIGFG